jgi:hypothetical protein
MNLPSNIQWTPSDAAAINEFLNTPLGIVPGAPNHRITVFSFRKSVQTLADSVLVFPGDIVPGHLTIGPMTSPVSIGMVELCRH